MSTFWLVVRTKQHREQWAAENVSRVGFPKYYLPQYLRTVRQGSMKVAKANVLFPSYLFVESDGRWRVLLSTFGVTGVVLQGENPAVFPQRAIDELRAREDEHGFVRLPEAPKHKLVEGAAVRVRGGNFAGRNGIHAGNAANERVRVLLDFLGRKTPFLIAEDMLEAA